MLVLQSWPRGLVASWPRGLVASWVLVSHADDEAFAAFRARDDGGRKWSRIAIVIGDIQDARR